MIDGYKNRLFFYFISDGERITKILTCYKKDRGYKRKKKMKNNNLTLSKIIKLTGAKPYQVKYLHSLGKLPVKRDSQGAGIPILYEKSAVDVVKRHIRRNQSL